MSDTTPIMSLRKLRRSILAFIFVLLATLLVAAPASGTGGGKWAPDIRVFAHTNDDGRASHADPGDIGGVSTEYDRWGRSSSGDPTTPGMDTTRVDSDVARCKAGSLDKETVRIKIQNAYPGYTCSFTVVTVNRAGVSLIIDEINIDVDPTLELVEIDTPAAGDHLKAWRRAYGTYAVTVLQEAPQAETLEFDIEVLYIHRRPSPPKCCHFGRR